eukprot:s166_g6.t1
MSFAFLAMNLLMEGSHVLLSGPAGAGKSFTASSAERSLRTLHKWTTVGAVWSRLTSLHQCRSTLNLCAGRCRPGRRHLVAGEVMLHVEDLNLPRRPQPHEALRAFMELPAASKELSIPSAQGIRVLATTGPLHALELRGQGPPWAPRLRRHFSELQLPEPAEEDVKKILQSISRHVLKVGGGCDALEAAFSGLAEEPVSGLKLKTEEPSAEGRFGLGDLAAFQTGQGWQGGVVKARPWHYSSRRQLAQLWTHESLRIYEDRLSSEAGRHKFRELLMKLLNLDSPSHFGLELSLSGQGPVFGVQMDSLRYQNFEDQDGEVSPLEMEMNPAQAFREAINEHNVLLEPGNQLPFVPFTHMLQHTLRISRVLAMRGTRLAVLLGPNNCGRRSACRAACCFFEAECCDVLKSIRTKGSAKEDYVASMRDCIMNAGKLGRRQLVLIRDTPCVAVNEETMEMILDSWHRFLRHGDLLNPEDLQDASCELPPEAQWRPLLFCALSVTSLKHLRNFPGFLAEAYIDCFLPFTDEALQGVITAVTGIDRDLSDKNSKFGPRQIAEAVTLDDDHLHFVNTNEAFCQKILAALDLFPQIFRMAPEAGRSVRQVLGTCASLRNFLDMLNTFLVSSTADIIKCRARRERMIRQCHVVTQVIEVVDESLGPLKEWMEKRRTLKAEVTELQTRLAEIQEEVKKQQAEVEKDPTLMLLCSDEAEKHRTEAAVKISSQVVALKTAHIRDAKEHYQMKMSVLAGVLHPDSLQELNSHQQDSVMVSQLVQCLCALVGLGSTAPLPVDGSLSSRLTGVDPTVVTKEMGVKFHGISFTNMDLFMEKLVKTSELVFFVSGPVFRTVAMPDSRIPAEREIARAPDAHQMMGHPEPTSATMAPEVDGDGVTVVDYGSEVHPAPASGPPVSVPETHAVVSETPVVAAGAAAMEVDQETTEKKPEPAEGVTLKAAPEPAVKKMPRKTIRKIAAKKMPLPPGVGAGKKKLQMIVRVKDEGSAKTAGKSPSELKPGGFHSRQAEKNKAKRAAWKAS